MVQSGHRLWSQKWVTTKSVVTKMGDHKKCGHTCGHKKCCHI